MGDRISNLPDAILFHILSFLPSKQAVATSLLSKRWKPLWHSVPVLDFDYFSYTEDDNSNCRCRFVQFVYAFILSRGLYQPLQRFRLSSYSSSPQDPNFSNMNVNVWVNDALQRRVQHLDLSFPWSQYVKESIYLSSIFNCKTLVVLKLQGIAVNRSSSVNLPSLKVLHLQDFGCLQLGYLADLLSGCPLVEDLKAINLEIENHLCDKEFKSFPKLVSAVICWCNFFMLKVVSNAQVLRIHGMSNSQNEEDVNIVNGIDKKHAIPVYHRLTYIQFNYMEYKKDWIAAVDLLKYCPKLEALVIEKRDVPFIWEDDGEIVNWLYPQSDSECISSHLKICTLKNYKGFKSEFQFAAYIMQNARFLRTMKICSTADHPWEKFRMLKELSSCTRCSKTCELSFE